MSVVAFAAAWVFPVAGPPIAGGVIEVAADGTIAAVRSGPDAGAVDLGRVAIVPGLVNPHCHLEFSDLTAPIGPPRPFPEWVRRVVAHRRTRTLPDAAIIARGCDELARTGTAAVGDILTADLLAHPYPASLYPAITDPIRRPQITAFREIIGPLPEAWPGLLDAAARHLETGRAAGLTPGLSPHAPYTVPQGLFERTLDLAATQAAPVAVHLAETAAERDLLANGTGELVALMASLGLWRPEVHPVGRRPLDWLQTLSRLPAAAVIHGNYLDDAEVAFLAAHPHLTLVYCPRTHAYFGHPPHPWQRVRDAGGSVALGTDGRSSNPDLDLWAEAAFVRRRHPEVPTETLLELITCNAAAAIGQADCCGVLAPGRAADFAVVRLTEAGAGVPDLFAPGNRIVRCFRAGVEIGDGVG